MALTYTGSAKQLLKVFHRHNKSLPDIYIFSLPRSGSTLLAEILNTDPETKTASESFAMNKDNMHILRKYFKEAFLSERYTDISSYEFRSMISYFSALSEGKTWNAYYWSDLLTRHHQLHTSRTLFKTHKMTYHFDDLMRHFENDFGIYLMRHPIAVSLSRIRMGWSTYIEQYKHALKLTGFISNELIQTIETIQNEGTALEKQVLSWCLENAVYLNNKLQKTMPENVITVFYEDLILNPKKTLLTICSRTRLEFHPDMLKMIARPSSGIIHSQKDVKKEILARNNLYLVNRWKQEVDGHSLLRIESMLHKFGYDFYLNN
jgi:hypothetical protein